MVPQIIATREWSVAEGYLALVWLLVTMYGLQMASKVFRSLEPFVTRTTLRVLFVDQVAVVAALLEGLGEGITHRPPPEFEH
jgi:hypothetical protein